VPVPGRLADTVYRDLLSRWGDPRRGYHDLQHLDEVLTLLPHLPSGRQVSVRLAAWFHDAVYEPAAEAGASEEASAALLAGVAPALGFGPDAVTEAGRLVRMTATHEVEPGDRHAAALADADLAILASAPDRYLSYAAGVRGEYRHVPDAAFVAGRTAVLRRLLAHDPLFHTAVGRARFEQAARANVETELRMLADLAASDTTHG